jgi:hypothetical protein
MSRTITATDAIMRHAAYYKGVCAGSMHALAACKPVEEVRGLAAADGESFSAAAPEVVSATCTVPAGSCPWPDFSRVRVNLLLVLLSVLNGLSKRDIKQVNYGVEEGWPQDLARNLLRVLVHESLCT